MVWRTWRPQVLTGRLSVCSRSVRFSYRLLAKQFRTKRCLTVCFFYHQRGRQSPSRGCVACISCENVTDRMAYTYYICCQGDSRRTDSRLTWCIRRGEADRNAGPSVEITQLISRACTLWGSFSSPGTSLAHIPVSGLDIILPSSSTWSRL